MYIYDVSVWETPCTFCSENAKSIFSILTVSKKIRKIWAGTIFDTETYFTTVYVSHSMHACQCHFERQSSSSRLYYFHFFFHENVRARTNRALIKRRITMLMHALFLSSGTMRHNGANVWILCWKWSHMFGWLLWEKPERGLIVLYTHGNYDDRER